MDQQDTTQQQTPTSPSPASTTAAPQGLMSEQQKTSLITELGLDSLPEDQKVNLVNTMVDTVLDRIFARISPSLTESDMQTIEALQNNPQSDQAINQYLMSRVPAMGSIAEEEVKRFRDEMKSSVEAIKAALPQS
jgi:hypothetical protein